MAQIVDLGSHSFGTNCLRGRCLVSRATATLIRGDNTNATGPTYYKVDFQNAWITLKQELFVDLYIEAYSDPIMSMPNFVKQVVETVQASLISDSPCLRMSTIHHEYRRLGGPVVLHISVVLRQVPDLSPRILPRRLPRKVKECAAEPHPPPGIDRATISHIAIYMRTLEQCTPWRLFLTNLWLKHPHSHERDTSPTRRSSIVVLCPPRSLPLLAPRGNADASLRQTHCLASGDKCIQQTNNCSGRGDSESVDYTNLHEMVNCSLRYYLVNENKQQHKGLVNKSTIEEGPSLSNVVPAFFKPGHYENIRQRAGLVPVVARSMARIFRTRQSSNELHGYRKDRCWTSLPVIDQTINEVSDTILLSEHDLLTEGSDQYDDSDGQMLNSSISSETGFDDIKFDSGYSSVPSPEKILPGFLDLNSLYGEVHDETTSGESVIDDGEADLIARPNMEERDIIRSSSFPPAVSDICADNDVTSDSLWSSEAFDQDDLDLCKDQHDEDMMETSSSISIISSSTYQYIQEDLKREPEVKLEHHETGYINDSLRYI